MRFRKLGSSDLEVSEIALGAWLTYAGGIEFDQTRACTDAAFEAGINFFDTANMYQRGVAESMLGQAIQGRRDKLVIASKVFFKMGEEPDQQGLSRKAILHAIDESLKRLNTDYLDLYYFHAPDHVTPIEESLEAMHSLVQAGKVRYAATSNYAAWQVVQMHWLAKERGYQPPYISQPMYNLLARGIEQEYLAMCQELGVSTVVYNPLAGGLLTGKHQHAEVTPGTRFDSNKLYQDRYWHRQDFEAVEKLRAIASAAGRSLISVSLNWLLHHTQSDCVILGASSMRQLEENLAAAAEGPLPEQTVQACDQVWQELRGPLPVYNR
jgi:aryl-alcohol dehydrogenase-like predicted oxidoreductase